MKYKEFYNWCNDRCFDGCWGMTEAIICCNCIEDIQSLPFWKRNKRWNEVSKEIVALIVEPTNKKIEEYKNGNRISNK